MYGALFSLEEQRSQAAQSVMQMIYSPRLWPGFMMPKSFSFEIFFAILEGEASKVSSNSCL